MTAVLNPSQYPTAAGLPAGAVDRIAAAIEHGGVDVLERALVELREDGVFDEQRCFVDPLPDRYSRRLVWRDEYARFVVVGMSWAPEQSAALHDHGGFWGGEIVVAGTMRERLYRCTARDDFGHYRFAEAADRLADAGSAGMLAPPHEYHTFGNAGSTVARTLHVYSGDLVAANLFLPESGAWYRAQRTVLKYDE
jgi:predicted metal-dependent enzyme (double-stranded beta helix superfamily)